ncbi:ABC transporter ATP-binding protein [Amaricoccus solimangrovi]|uniref:ABC transporter ATP-binding protein n=1 Tax=Amaricoccus solimangrovi TaxID=2589815 RepID=UPI001F44906F|nr:ABC transporter ATP-binding protein [Amaricoccus solimangrovi]
MEFKTRHGEVRALDRVSFDLRAGETLGIVGESGSGKSVTARSIMRLLPRNARVTGGEIRYDGRDLLTLSDREFRGIRGKAISMVLQDPLTSLNPVFRIGWQVGEAVTIQQGLRGAARDARSVDLLRGVNIPAPEIRLHNYPHEMSGGMRQRVVSATALAGNPRILICDEPTTALDATIQAQFLNLLRGLQEAYGLAIIFITHDFSVVAEMCDRVAVMYSGQIRERGDVFEIFDHPAHPYTRALLASVPKLGETERLTTIPGQPPSSANKLPGCAFAPRCPIADSVCHASEPPDMALRDDHTSLCWRAQ